ncbi:MucBP domain-containing protein [Weissella diestrammenae]|uniref:MucBP domain-containing protein n=1 Tax=Weissella diestrammenae TaxID=1162633 RepID=A0A7G9T581_9LACO|nr:MucBP domain-containing protein [Weissella diestrammenae]MCM0583111.1 MucBP domain-containing protein [Weissella diestrammenae]QNN75256.1 MucBP domain-containing protein [Weissella diestrammenae]
MKLFKYIFIALATSVISGTLNGKNNVDVNLKASAATIRSHHIAGIGIDFGTKYVDDTLTYFELSYPQNPNEMHILTKDNANEYLSMVDDPGMVTFIQNILDDPTDFIEKNQNKKIRDVMQFTSDVTMDKLILQNETQAWLFQSVGAFKAGIKNAEDIKNEYETTYRNKYIAMGVNEPIMKQQDAILGSGDENVIDSFATPMLPTIFMLLNTSDVKELAKLSPTMTVEKDQAYLNLTIGQGGLFTDRHGNELIDMSALFATRLPFAFVDHGKVTVNYVTDDGENIIDPITLTGSIGSIYQSKSGKELDSSQAIKFNGLNLIDVVGDSEGMYTDQPKTITYRYSVDDAQNQQSTNQPTNKGQNITESHSVNSSKKGELPPTAVQNPLVFVGVLISFMTLLIEIVRRIW